MDLDDDLDDYADDRRDAADQMKVERRAHTDSGPGVGEDVPPPSFTRTYSWVDGEVVGDDYTWSHTDDGFDADIEPRAQLVETWKRTAVEVRWIFPSLGACTYEDQEQCEEDAVVWQQEPGTPPVWMEACERHRLARPTCKGFQWIGQPITSCEGCGEPAWDHDYDMQADRGPFASLSPTPWTPPMVESWRIRGFITDERAAHLASLFGRPSDG